MRNDPRTHSHSHPRRACHAPTVMVLPLLAVSPGEWASVKWTDVPQVDTLVAVDNVWIRRPSESKLREAVAVSVCPTKKKPTEMTLIISGKASPKPEKSLKWRPRGAFSAGPRRRGPPMRFDLAPPQYPSRRSARRPVPPLPRARSAAASYAFPTRPRPAAARPAARAREAAGRAGAGASLAHSRPSRAFCAIPHSINIWIPSGIQC